MSESEVRDNDEHWQPFDGQFKAGVEYRSRDGRVVKNPVRMFENLVRLQDDLGRDYWVFDNGKLSLIADNPEDITHQRPLAAERPASDANCSESPNSSTAAHSPAVTTEVERMRASFNVFQASFMLSGVKPTYECAPFEVVRYTDYAALAAERDGLKAEVERVKERTTELNFYITAVRDFNDRLLALGHEPGGFVIDSIWVCDEVRKAREQVAEANQRCEAAEREVEGLKGELKETESAYYNLAKSNAGVLEASSNRQQRQAAEIDAAWEMIRNSFDIEPRSVLEDEAQANGFKYGLAQAIHHIWKRDAKVATLTAERDRLAGELADAQGLIKAYVDIRSNHPQVAGEMWRDMVAYVDKIAGREPNHE